MKKSIATFVFSITSLLGFAQESLPTQTLSLSQAIDYGKNNNLTLQNAKLDIDKANEQIKEIRSIGMPQLNGSFTFNDFLQIPASFIPASAFDPTAPKNAYAKIKFGTQYQAQASLQASQLIFDGGYLVGLQATKEIKNLYQQSYNKTELDVETNVTKAYFSALTIDENIKILEINIERVGKLLHEMTEMNKAGFVERLEVDKLELSASTLKINKKKLESLKEIAYKALKLQMGMEVNSPLKLTDKLEDLYKNSGEDLSVTTFTVSSRLEYKQLDQLLKLKQLDKKRYEYGWIPNVAAFASHQQILNRNGETLFKKDPFLPWVPTTVVGFRIGVPIYDGGMKFSKTAQAEIGIKQTKNNLSDLSNALSLEFAAASTSYSTALETLKNQKANMELAEKIYNAVSAKFTAGLGSSMELQSAETDLKTSQVSYINAISTLLNAKIDLRKAIGARQ
ncbi:MAG: TolC family protein [Flavobacteriaceae bacterium]|nr:TolC family protein [Flavobacteriaceae bacterium]